MPTLMRSPHDMYDLHNKSDKDKLNKLTRLLNDIHDRYQTLGIAWCMNHNKEAMPVIIINDPKIVYDHLITWAENKPEEWFTCVWESIGQDYNLFLIPNIQKSADRFKETHGSKATHLQIIFHVLGTEIRASATFNADNFLMGRKEIEIGFISLDEVKTQMAVQHTVKVPCVRYSELDEQSKKFYEVWFNESNMR